MKQYRLKNPWFLPVACLVLQGLNALSQVTTLSEVLSNAETRAQVARSNVNAAAEYRRLHPNQGEVEWASNVMRNWKPGVSWPEASQKKEILAHCAAVVRSALDAKEIELATSELTNQPNALEIKNFLVVAASNLNEYAAILTSPELSTYVAPFGYAARLCTTSDFFIISFWPTNRLPGLVRDIERRTPDARHVIVKVLFYENGKLENFRVNSPAGKGLAFNEEGYLYHYWAVGSQPYWALHRLKKTLRAKP